MSMIPKQFTRLKCKQCHVKYWKYADNKRIRNKLPYCSKECMKQYRAGLLEEALLKESMEDERKWNQETLQEKEQY